MSAPRTARSVPTAWNSPCHSANCAFAVETVCGGMPFAAMSARIMTPKSALKPNSPPKSATTIASMMIMRLVILRLLKFLFSVCDFRGQPVLPFALPPSAAQRLEKRRSIRIARRLRLNETDLRLLVLALRVVEREIVRPAELELPARHFEAFARGGLGLGLRLERDRVELQSKQHVRDVLERAEHGLLILREGLIVGRFRSALSRLELSRMENRLKQAGADVPDPRSRVEQLGRAGCGAAVTPAQGQLREHERLRHADACVGLVQNGFGRADVGPLAHEIRGQAQRKGRRQLERREIELGQARVAGKFTDEDRELIAGLRERLLERRQIRARLRKLRALSEHIYARNCAERKLLLDQLHLALLRLGDLARRANLLPQRRFAERGGGDIPRQRKICGLELKALEIYARLQGLELAPSAAGEVDGVGHVDRGVVEIEDVGGNRRISKRRAGDPLTLRRQACVHARIENRVLGVQVLLGLAERGLRRSERRMAGERRAHEVVELRRAEKGPPLGGDLCPHFEALRLAAAHRGRFGPLRLRPFGIGAGGGRFRRPIVGPHRAGREKSGRPGDRKTSQRNKRRHFFSLACLPSSFGPRPTTSARTASRNWRCALASPPEPPWKKWSRKAVLKLTASIRAARSGDERRTRSPAPARGSSARCSARSAEEGPAAHRGNRRAGAAPPRESARPCRQNDGRARLRRLSPHARCRAW